MRYFLNVDEGLIVASATEMAGLSELDPVRASVMYRAQQAGEELDLDVVALAVLTGDEDQMKLVEARTARRAQLLAESDWCETQRARDRMTPEQLAAWDAYRDALYDMDLSVDDWPVMPEGGR